jgi:hypothetical protein
LHKRGGKDGKAKAWRNELKQIGSLSEDEVADIKKVCPSMNVTAGTRRMIDADQLNHALLEHGEESTRRRRTREVPITEADLAKIPSILECYDLIVEGRGKRHGKKQDAVEYWKRIDNNHLMCVEVEHIMHDGEVVLKFQTMMKLQD